MKAVLDTNVVVSGLLSGTGPCGRILDLVLEGIVPIATDVRILAEYEEVVRRPQLAIPATEAAKVLASMGLAAEPVTAPPLPAFLPDADDQPFLEVAAAARAVLVTGNRRHFPTDVCQGVRVLSPAEFLDLLREEGAGG